MFAFCANAAMVVSCRRTRVGWALQSSTANGIRGRPLQRPSHDHFGPRRSSGHEASYRDHTRRTTAAWSRYAASRLLDRRLLPPPVAAGTAALTGRTSRRNLRCWSPMASPPERGLPAPRSSRCAVGPPRGKMPALRCCGAAAPFSQRSLRKSVGYSVSAKTASSLASAEVRTIFTRPPFTTFWNGTSDVFGESQE